MVVSNCQTQACFDAWVNCENLMVHLAKVHQSLSRKVTKVVDECALICMGTFHALKSKSRNISRFALLCVGICEECAEVCETLEFEEFQNCAKICRVCSQNLTTLASSSFD